MSPPIPVRLIRQVRHRACDVCEYCRLPQASQEATLHVDHVSPRSQGGPTELANLALACVTCSLRKAARITATWRFRGRTDTGRSTIAALGMNRTAIVLIRRELAVANRIARKFTRNSKCGFRGRRLSKKTIPPPPVSRSLSPSDVSPPLNPLQPHATLHSVPAPSSPATLQPAPITPGTGPTTQPRFRSVPMRFAAQLQRTSPAHPPNHDFPQRFRPFLVRRVGPSAPIPTRRRYAQASVEPGKTLVFAGFFRFAGLSVFDISRISLATELVFVPVSFLYSSWGRSTISDDAWWKCSSRSCS